MKVLIIVSYPLPGDPFLSGASAVAYNLVDSFKYINNIELLVVSLLGKDEDVILHLSQNIEIRFYKRQYSHHKIEIIKHIKPKLLNIIKQWNPDIVHIGGNGISMALYDQSFKDKLVITQHGIHRKEIKYAKQWKHKLNKILTTFIAYKYEKYFKNWIFLSEYNLKLSTKHNNAINYVKIYNPVNPIFFNIKEFHIKRKNTLRLFFVGQISPLKGLIDLLFAIKKCGNEIQIYLDIVGGFSNSAYEQKYLSYIKENNLSNRVTLHGRKTSDEIIEIGRNIDVLVLPSYQEVLPCVIAESMAMGLIAVATTVGGIPEMIIDGETGFLYTPGDIDKLSEILLSLYYMPADKYTKISKNARKRAIELYEPINIAKQHYEFYSTIMGENN